LVIFWHFIGVAFFIVAIVLAVYGILVTLLRTLLSWTPIFRTIMNFFVFLFIICELGLAAWSLYMAYLFIVPFTHGGWSAHCPNGLDYTGYWSNPDCYFLQVWYAIGISFSLLIPLQSFCLISVTFEIMRPTEEEKAIQRQNAPPEAQPLVGRGQPQYTDNVSKYA
jgi:hypothetical protein